MECIVYQFWFFIEKKVCDWYLNFANSIDSVKLHIYEFYEVWFLISSCKSVVSPLTLQISAKWTPFYTLLFHLF